jgi:phytanoyl-CoA hydroxylase
MDEDLTISAAKVLSGAQIAEFHREGYLVLERVLDDEDLQPVIDDICAEVDRRARALAAAGELRDTYTGEDFLHRLACISRETEKLALSIWDSSLALPAMFELIRHPKLLDIAEALCGHELIASSVYRLRPKIPKNLKSPVPWHQDSGYFEPYCDKSLVLTMWIPLVKTTRENGCMWVMPRGHRDGRVLRHAGSKKGPYLEIEEADLPRLDVIPAEMKKGDVLLLTNLTPHASFDNNSDHVRWSMDLRYQNAALPTNAKITRLAGESTEDAQTPIACYPPEADFLVRSRLRPGEVVGTFEEFERLRREHVRGPVSNRWFSRPSD